LATDRNGQDGSDVPELIIQGGNELTIFRFQENSEPWNFPTDSPARYQPIGFFRGSGGVGINLSQGSANYGRVTVIDRNGYERSQLAVRSVYGLITGSDGNQTYLDPLPPLGGVGGPQVAAPIYSTVDFNPTPPDELFNTPFPEKMVLGFYAATCGTQDGTLCNDDNMASGLLWRPPTASLADFLAEDALSAFNSGNPDYFSLPAFNGNSNILVAQLCYYPQLETDPDLLESGGGRDVITGEQGQQGMVDIAFNIGGSARQTARYEMRLQAGRWKILRRLQAPQTACSLPSVVQNTPPPVAPAANPNAAEVVLPTVTPSLAAEANGPYRATVCQGEILFSSSGSGPVELITEYAWDFGDGTTGSGPSPTHTYKNPGVYTATLTVRSGSVPPNPATDVASVTIDLPPQPPCNPPSCCG
jgi:chitodextrinase